MKKFLSVLLVVALVLSVSVTAFADGSPVKNVTSEDLPAAAGEISRIVDAGAPAENKSGDALPAGAVSMVSNGNFSDEQKEAADKAIADATDAGYLPIAVFAFEVEEEYQDEFNAKIYRIHLEDDEVVFVDGVKFEPKDLKALGNNWYELVLSAPAVIVIAKAK